MPKAKKKVVSKIKTRLKTPLWYIITSIILSASTLLINFILDNSKLNLLNILISIIFIAWLIINIVMLIKFVRKKYEFLAIWLSSIYLFDFVFTIFVGIVAGIYAVLNNLSIEALDSSLAYNILPNIFPVVTLIIAIKLLLKK